MLNLHEYKFYRFRQIRNNLFPGDLRELVFPPCIKNSIYGYECLQSTSGHLINYPKKIEKEKIDQNLLRSIKNTEKIDGYLLNDFSNNNQLDYYLLVREYVAWAMGGIHGFSENNLIGTYLQLFLLFSISRIQSPEMKEDVSNLFKDMENLSAETRLLADFLYDFYLSPMVFVLDQDLIGPKGVDINNSIRNYLHNSGTPIISKDIFQAKRYPKFWNPLVYLFVTDRNDFDLPKSNNIPNCALKVLVDISSENVNADGYSGWDLCFAYRNMGTSPACLPHEWSGWIYSANIQAILKLIDIRARAQHIRELLPKIFGTHSQDKYKISVIIATYRRPVSLNYCIQSLYRQTISTRDFEIIVVNNDPQDNATERVVDDYIINNRNKLGTPNLKIINCYLPGLSNARNAGLSEASGEIICFLDDDAIAHDTWLEEIWKGFALRPKIGIIGGHIYLVPPKPRPKILKNGLERFWTHFVTPYKGLTSVNDYMQFPWGANWCIRRNVIWKIGGFRRRYGRKKNDYSGGEEIIAAISVLKLGYEVAILPDAAVEHHPSVDRYTFKYLRKTIQNQIITHYRMTRDLYIDREISIRENFRGIRRFIYRVKSLFRLPISQQRAMLLEYYCYILAWANLLVEQTIDYINRITYDRRF